MSANLITGNLFKPIYAYQDADYQAGISGNVTSIMPVGSQMALSIEDANTIKADDGVLITKEGRRIQIDAGAIEEWSIPTGTQGATNYFIIGFHLYTDSNSAEVCETFVEKMENATDTIPEGTFREGSTEVYVSLGRVVQNGINLDSVTSLVQIAQSFEDVKNAITQLNSDLPDKLSIRGGSLTGSLNLSNNTNDTPEITFTSKDYGYAHLDYYNGAFRILNSIDTTKNVQIGADALFVNSVNVLKQVKFSGTNVAWTNAPDNTLSWYAYEGANVSTYNLPHNHCAVEVFKTNSTRGVALAYRWNDVTPDIPNVWINRLHDSWKGWIPISAISNVVFIGTSTVNHVIYTPTAGVKSMLVELIEGRVQILAQMVVPINADSVGKYYRITYGSSYFQVYMTAAWQLATGEVNLGENLLIRVTACY